MANTATVEHSSDSVWGGGRQPFGADYGKMMMWFFLMSDALTFSAFFGFRRFFPF